MATTVPKHFAPHIQENASDFRRLDRGVGGRSPTASPSLEIAPADFAFGDSGFGAGVDAPALRVDLHPPYFES
jgi:hypothetical protein